jgi:hypothetical protein
MFELRTDEVRCDAGDMTECYTMTREDDLSDRSRFEAEVANR